MSFAGYPAIKPLPKQKRQLPEKKQLFRGEITKVDWERKKFGTEFKKSA